MTLVAQRMLGLPLGSFVLVRGEMAKRPKWLWLVTAEQPENMSLLHTDSTFFMSMN